MHRNHWSLLLWSLTLLAGLTPAAEAQTTPNSPYDSTLSKRTKVVGVMVASGYQAQVVTLGTLLNVGRIDDTIALNDDRLSDRIFTQVKAELELEQRYEVRRLQIRPERARKLVNELWNRHESRFGSWPKDMKELVSHCECDAVLLLADGPSHNTMVEAGLTFGPSFVGKSGVFGGKEVGRAHVRFGLLAMLVDPTTGDRIRTGTTDDRPDYQSDAKAYWPGADGVVSEAHWQRMSSYLDGLRPVYRGAIAMVGLRPSCAHLYYQSTNTARSGEPPQPPPADEAIKCPQ